MAHQRGALQQDNAAHEPLDGVLTAERSRFAAGRSEAEGRNGETAGWAVAVRMAASCVRRDNHVVPPTLGWMSSLISVIDPCRSMKSALLLVLTIKTDYAQK